MTDPIMTTLRVALSAIVFAFLLPANLAALQVDPPDTAGVARYEVGSALPPVDDGRTMVDMTLEEAIERALENNLNIRSARLAPEIQRYSRIAAEAAFNPSLNTTLGYSNQTNQSTSQLDGGLRTTNRQNSLNFSLQQPLPWYGAQLGASFNNSRNETNNAFTTRNPSYRSTLSFNFTQPLLSGRRMDSQRNALRTQDVQREITDIQLRTQIETLRAQVRQAYWGLRAQIEQIEIQRRNLAQAEQLLENNRVRVELGTMVASDLAQAEAQVAAAEQALLNAEIQWRNQELAFKQLLVGGTDDPLYRQAVNPVDLPEYEQRSVDIAAAIATAMQNRPDLQQEHRQREISEMNLDVTRENARPNLNLSASYSLQGVGGNLFDRGELGGDPQLVEPGGYFDGLSSIANFDTPALSLSLNFSYPIGTSAQEANFEQARIQLRQAELQLRAQELQIETEVTNAGYAVTNTYLQLEAARRSREAAERSAEAEMTRFTVGVSTNFQVAAAQDQLTSARLSELQAIIAYINALEEFERVQGTSW